MFHKIITFWLVVFSFQNLVGMDAAETSKEPELTPTAKAVTEYTLSNGLRFIDELSFHLKKFPKTIQNFNRLPKKQQETEAGKLQTALEECLLQFNQDYGNLCVEFGYPGNPATIWDVRLFEHYRRRSDGKWTFVGNTNFDHNFTGLWKAVAQGQVMACTYRFLSDLVKNCYEKGVVVPQVEVFKGKEREEVKREDCSFGDGAPKSSSIYEKISTRMGSYAFYLTGRGPEDRPLTPILTTVYSIMQKLLPKFFREDDEVYIPFRLLPFTPDKTVELLTHIVLGSAGSPGNLGELSRVAWESHQVAAMAHFTLENLSYFDKLIESLGELRTVKVEPAVSAPASDAERKDALAWAEEEAKREATEKPKTKRSSSRRGGGKASGGSSGGGGSSDAVPQPGDHLQTGRSSTGDAPSPRTASVQDTLQVMAKAASGKVIPEEGGEWLDPRGRPLEEGEPQAAAASKGKSKGKRRHGRAGKANDSKKPDPTTMPDKESASGRDSVRTPTFTATDFPPLSPASKSASQKVGQEEPKPVVVPRTPSHSPVSDNSSVRSDGGVGGRLETIREDDSDAAEDGKSTDDKGTSVAASGSVVVDDDGTASEDEDAPDGEGDLEDADGPDGQGSEAVVSVAGGLAVKPQEPLFVVGVASPIYSEEPDLSTAAAFSTFIKDDGYTSQVKKNAVVRKLTEHINNLRSGKITRFKGFFKNYIQTILAAIHENPDLKPSGFAAYEPIFVEIGLSDMILGVK